MKSTDERAATVDKYKSPLGLPKTGHELLTCYYPLRLDTYSGCSHNCRYCYAMDMMKPRGYWDNIRPADFDIIEGWFSGKGKDPMIKSALRHRIPVRMGGLTDCFQVIEKKYEISYKTLKLLSEEDYPYLIVTKSPLLSEDRYLDILRSDLANIQYTVISLDEDTIKKLEPGAPPVSSRIEAIKKLSSHGFHVTGRISPIFPTQSVEELKELMYVLHHAGVEHILVEFFRGNERMLDRVSSVFGDLRPYMKKKGYYWRVKEEIKKNIYRKLREYADEINVGFSICSDGDPVPCRLNTTENCCGTDKISSHKSGSSCVSCEVYNIANKNGGEASLEDFSDMFCLDRKLFKNSWDSGELECFVDGIEKKGKKYVIKEELKWRE